MAAELVLEGMVSAVVREHSSDEDTEDASEPEMTPDDCSRNGCLQDKLSVLRCQLGAIQNGGDDDYLSRVATLTKERNHRLFVAETFRDYELCVAREELEREKLAALNQFDAKRAELKDCLLHDLQEKRRAYDNYRHTVELGAAADTIESKNMVTRKLRRRAQCDPSSLSDGKRRKTATHSLVYLLDDLEVEDDVRTLCKSRVSVAIKKNPPPVPVAGGEGTIMYEAHIEDGRLFYEGKWFHKGQHIFIVSKEHGQESGVITSISQSEIWVRRLPDHSKLRMYISQLTRGKYVLKRRSA